ncbi:MAG: hypothetical protein J5618_03355 [Bacilli bacterium]|nr:hypothetical protein [Bacilli bacterium]
MFYVLQEDNYDCGFTCLKVLLANVNKDSNYLYLPNPKANGEVYSFNELSEYASELGFTLSAYKIADRSTLSLDDGLPMMFSLSRDEKSHMVLVYKINKKDVYYFDPSCGKKKMRIEQFIELWDCKLLKLDNFKRISCPHKVSRLLLKKEEIAMDILEILACLSMALGLCFIDEKYPFYLSVIMFASFAILEILLRSYCLFVFKKIDERTYNDSLKVKKGKMRDFYLTLEENKKMEVSLNLNSIYCIMSVVVIILYLGVIGGYSLYYLFFSILFVFIEVTFIEPYLNKKNQEIIELEANIGDEDFGIIKLAHEKAYQYGKVILAYRYVVLGLTLLGIVLIMALSEVVSIPYIIFYLCLNIFFYKNLVSGLSTDENIKKHRQNIVHQINLIDK